MQPRCQLQPPITVHGIPGRYASALYTSAAKAGTLDKVQEELTEVKYCQLLQPTAYLAAILYVLDRTAFQAGI